MHRDIDAAMIERLIGLARQIYQFAHGPASKNWHAIGKLPAKLTAPT
jgi:hypothetical protein